MQKCQFVAFGWNVAIYALCRILAGMSRFTRFPRHKMSAARHLKLFCTPGVGASLSWLQMMILRWASAPNQLRIGHSGCGSNCHTQRFSVGRVHEDRRTAFVKTPFMFQKYLRQATVSLFWRKAPNNSSSHWSRVWLKWNLEHWSRVLQLQCLAGTQVLQSCYV